MSEEFDDESPGGYLSDDYVYEDEDNDNEEYVAGSTLPCNPNVRLSLSSSIDEVLIITRDAAKQRFIKQVKQCADVLNLPFSVAAVLLRDFKFNLQNLTERFFADSDSVLKKAKISSSTCEPHFGNPAITDFCDICCEDVKGDKLIDMGSNCNHAYCIDCYKRAMEGKVEDGEVFALRCIKPSCGCAANEKFLDAVLSPEIIAKIERFVVDQYVVESPQLAFCPNSACTLILHFPQHRTELDVACTCGVKFCVRCFGEGHAPASCKNVREWHSKDGNEGMSASWLKDHTKECPKCLSSIEKNGGCMHMTCKKCRHEFCWLCCKDYKGHAACNSFVSGAPSEARASIERYSFYWERYSGHVASLKLEEQHLTQIKSRALEMMKTMTTAPANEADYLIEAALTLTRCRRTLKYTYIHAFYVENKLEKDLFEHLQADLEKNTEDLARLVEKSDHVRFDVINQQKMADRRLLHLLSSTADGILNVGGDFHTAQNEKEMNEEMKKKKPRGNSPPSLLPSGAMESISDVVPLPQTRAVSRVARHSVLSP